MRYFMVFSTVALVASALSTKANGQEKNADLYVYAYCDETTEHGEDELYYLMSVDGGPVQRIPATGHWNIINNGPKRKVVQKLLTKNLKPGEVTKIVLTVMEEDGGIPPKFIEGLNEAGKQYARDKGNTAQGIAALVGGLLQLIGGNTDDVIGAIAITLKNENGKIINKAISIHPKTEPTPLFFDQYPVPNFRCKGDGSSYHITEWAGGPRAKEPITGEYDH